MNSSRILAEYIVSELTEPQATVFAAVADGMDLSKSIASYTGIQTRLVSVHLRRLEDKFLLVSQPYDGRRRIYSLSDVGMAICKSL